MNNQLHKCTILIPVPIQLGLAPPSAPTVMVTPLTTIPTGTPTLTT